MDCIRPFVERPTPPPPDGGHLFGQNPMTTSPVVGHGGGSVELLTHPRGLSGMDEEVILNSTTL